MDVDDPTADRLIGLVRVTEDDLGDRPPAVPLAADRDAEDEDGVKVFLTSLAPCILDAAANELVGSRGKRTLALGAKQITLC